MISDEVGRQLHDRASRGGSLSTEERQQLDAWLSAQDQAEASLLSPQGVDPALADLRGRVDSALEKVGAVTRNIQRLSADNDSLRRENAVLRRQLASRPVSGPA